CNNYCTDGACGTRDFFNRFSLYNITAVREAILRTASIEASITSSILAAASSSSAAAAAATSSYLAALSSSSAAAAAAASRASSTTLLTPSASSPTSPTSPTAAPADAAQPASPTPTTTRISPVAGTGNASSTASDTPFLQQPGGILMMLSLAILAAIAAFVVFRFYRRRSRDRSGALPVFHVLPRKTSSSDGGSDKAAGGSTLGRGWGGGSLGRQLGSGGPGTPNSATLDRGSLQRTGSAAAVGVGALGLERSASAASSVSSLSPLGSAKKGGEDLVHQVFGLSKVEEERRGSGSSAGDPLSVK
ncbi:hypothetical protein HDU96_004361, partial [Phlyctochytrium bullatum]